MYCFGYLPPCFSHKRRPCLAVSGDQLAGAIRDSVVTCKDVSEDADVSRPIGNLHVSGEKTQASLQAPSQYARAQQPGLGLAAGAWLWCAGLSVGKGGRSPTGGVSWSRLVPGRRAVQVADPTTPQAGGKGSSGLPTVDSF